MVSKSLISLSLDFCVYCETFLETFQKIPFTHATGNRAAWDGFMLPGARLLGRNRQASSGS